MSEQAPQARRRPGGRTARVRDQVLQATMELVARHGLEGLQYEDVARVAGVNRTTVHRNWASRELLVRDALARYADTSVPLPDTGDLAADLTELLCGVARIGGTPIGRALMRITMSGGDEPPAGESATGAVSLRELGLRTLEARLPAMQARLDHAASRGELPPVDAYFLNEMLVGPVHMHLTRARRQFERRDAERIVGLVLAGLRAAAREPAASKAEADADDLG